MAQFEPKKLNIGEINGGNRFNNGDGVSAEAINAPIEAVLYAEEIAQEAIGVKEQVQEHEERIAKTEYDTKMLYAIASQKGLYAVAEVEQAYTSRVTADGQNIVDGQKTPVTMIKGSTVRDESTNTLKHAKINKIVSTGRNLLDISKLVGDALVDNGDGTYTMTKNNNNRFSNTWTFDTPIQGGALFEQFETLEKTTEYDYIGVQITLSDGTTKFTTLKDISTNHQGACLGEWKAMRFYLEGAEDNGAYITFKNPFITRGVEGNNYYTPFIQETYRLPETLELGEWDTFNPQTGEITRATSKQLVLTGEEDWGMRDTINSYSGGTLRRMYISLKNDVSIEDINSVQAVSSLYNGVPTIDTWNNITGVSISGQYLDIYDPDFAMNDISLWKAHLAELYAKGTPLIVEYKLATPTVEKLEYAPKSYTAYNQGNETAVLENEEFGAIPTITNEYIVVL